MTSGIAFQLLFSPISSYLCSVTLGKSQTPNTVESEPIYTLSARKGSRTNRKQAPAAGRKPREDPPYPKDHLLPSMGRLGNSGPFPPGVLCVPPAHTSFRAGRVKWQFLLGEA